MALPPRHAALHGGDGSPWLSRSLVVSQVITQRAREVREYGSQATSGKTVIVESYQWFPLKVSDRRPINGFGSDFK